MTSETKVEGVPLGRLDALGPALRALRERAGLRPEELASGCGLLGFQVSREVVEAWEPGAVLPSLPELVAVMVVLQTSPASVFVEVLRVLWREALTEQPARVAALLDAWHQQPLEQELVRYAGRLEGASFAPVALGPELHARAARLREQVRGGLGVLDALANAKPAGPDGGRKA